VTVNTLREMLKDLDGDIEVRIMHQENYPFEYDVKGTILASDIPNTVVDDEDEWWVPNEPNSTDDAFYIVDGNQLGYGTSDAWEFCTER